MRNMELLMKKVTQAEVEMKLEGQVTSWPVVKVSQTCLCYILNYFLNSEELTTLLQCRESTRSQREFYELLPYLPIIFWLVSSV